MFLLIQELAIFFSVKGQTVNSFGFVGQSASATNTQLFHKAAIDKNVGLSEAVFQQNFTYQNKKVIHLA